MNSLRHRPFAPQTHYWSAHLYRATLATAIAVLSMCTSLGVIATATADDTACSQPTSSGGVHQPTGADAGTFIYRCDGPHAGEWTNPYYAYNPGTGSRTALYAPDYAYDCTTDTWTMTEWDYSPATGQFYSVRTKPAATPTVPTNCPAAPTSPNPAGPNGLAGSDPSGDTATGNPGGTPATANPANSASPGSQPSSSSGPGGNNTTSSTTGLNSTVTNNTGVGMNNTIGSQAATGNTIVVGNTTGGNASTGDATALANIANLLQSTSNAFGPDTALFTTTINGDVTGDFMFDPSAILGTGPGSNTTVANNLQVNQTVANNTDASITNTIDVGAASGNATVADNTNGGNASSGNTQAVVNLMNVINSTVATGHSFIGSVNINGNLNGDILLPPGVLNALLAGNASPAAANTATGSPNGTGPGSTNTIATTVTDNSTTTNNVAMTTANHIIADASSGTATVSGNTNGGNASSGAAHSNVTLLNLTGSNTIGKNALLVFVNVLGRWVGMIMNAPAGTTAAELGGDVATGPGSTNTTTATATDNSSLTNNVTLAIANNVHAQAHSGDATVSGNTNGGNASSGNASVAVNVLNMEGSNLSLTDWFGVLFINVFGMWNGSFGINTSAGDPVTTSAGVLNRDTDSSSAGADNSANPVQAATHAAAAASFRRFASFAAAGAHSRSRTNGNTGSNIHNSAGQNTAGPASSTGGSDNFQPTAILGSTTTLFHDQNAHKPAGKSHTNLLLPTIGFVLALIILIAGERDRLFRRHHK
jgi:hypothetical protein